MWLQLLSWRLHVCHLLANIVEYVNFQPVWTCPNVCLQEVPLPVGGHEPSAKTWFLGPTRVDVPKYVPPKSAASCRDEPTANMWRGHEPPEVDLVTHVYVCRSWVAAGATAVQRRSARRDVCTGKSRGGCDRRVWLPRTGDRQSIVPTVDCHRSSLSACRQTTGHVARTAQPGHPTASSATIASGWFVLTPARPGPDLQNILRAVFLKEGRISLYYDIFLQCMVFANFATSSNTLLTVHSQVSCYSLVNKDI